MKVIDRLKNMSMNDFVGVVALVLHDECIDPALADCQSCKIRDVCKSYDGTSSLIDWLKSELK